MVFNSHYTCPLFPPILWESTPLLLGCPFPDQSFPRLLWDASACLPWACPLPEQCSGLRLNWSFCPDPGFFYRSETAPRGEDKVVREPHVILGAWGKWTGFAERFPAACPFGATHLALDSRGSSPGGEGDLCRGQVSNSLGVAVSVFAVGGS